MHCSQTEVASGELQLTAQACVTLCFISFWLARIIKSPYPQVVMQPGILSVTACSGPLATALSLSTKPAQPVTVSYSVPPTWDGASALASTQPAGGLAFTPDNFAAPQALLLQPAPQSGGNYYVTLQLS